MSDELDAATIAEYRRVLDEAARQLGADTGQRVAGATAAVFAALDRLDRRQKETCAIVRELAGLSITAADMFDRPEFVALTERARRVIGA